MPDVSKLNATFHFCLHFSGGLFPDPDSSAPDPQLCLEVEAISSSTRTVVMVPDLFEGVEAAIGVRDLDRLLLPVVGPFEAVVVVAAAAVFVINVAAAACFLDLSPLSFCCLFDLLFNAAGVESLEIPDLHVLHMY